MKRVRDLSLKMKIFGTFLFIMLLLVVGAAFTLIQMSEIGEEVDTFTDYSDRAIMITEVGSLVRSQYIDIADMIRTGGETFDEAAYEADQEKLNAYMNNLRDRMYSQQTQDLFLNVEVNLNSFYTTYSRMPDNSGPLQNQRMEELAESRSMIVEDTLELAEIIQGQAEQAGGTVNNIVEQNVIVFIVTIAVILLIGGTVFYFLAAVLSRSLKTVGKTMNEVSKGNLAVSKLKVNSKDELGKMSSAVNNMIDQLQRMLGSVETTADQVAASAEELLASSNETSRATEEISSSIQEVSNGAESQVEQAAENEETVSQISQSVSAITSSVSAVNKASGASSEKAAHGRDVIGKTAAQMEKINDVTNQIDVSVNRLSERSGRIGSIVSLINDVADQTNLLALNAAIEAARAGEHGKGFAVVADEVRKLAEQTTNATSEIGVLIEQIQEDVKLSVTRTKEGKEAVDQGSSYVLEAGLSFSDLTEAIQNVALQMKEVTCAVEEVESGVEQIASRSKETTTVAEQSASYTQNVAASAEEQLASMEEVSASANQLATTAEELQGILKEFKTK
ncbi:methyl-accepting chemotaxis protein [Alkalicoccus daliensis]|uniref:Methyl-accepting chemotaxis protein n=1 Tax=Alkalicoccus daliensis TaxID=745820 RepID=A0A1H0H0A4_9BACI|nr:HAMP domain-containing methyl-accepting chemotaxis protein [Alkalicoccus daliensis]SDO12464.1 methyl-accepting chemotaxis protein [Alkalicoccus daliensis]